jgi:integrase
MGFDDDGKRVRLRFVGPRGDKSEDAFYGLKDRLQQYQEKHPKPKRGQVHSRLNVTEYLDLWMERKTNLSEKGRVDYEATIENHIKPGLGRVRLRDLDRKRVREFFANLQAVQREGEPRKPLGDGGRGKVYTVLRAALNDAVFEDEILTVNPAARLRLEKTNTKPKVKGFWPASEQRQFLKTAKEQQPFYFTLLVTMLGGMLSQAEAFGIRWCDIDLQTGLVSIVGDLVEVEGRLVYRGTKTDSRVRSFKLPAVALGGLQARYKAEKPKATDYVFTTPDGAPIRRTNFNARIWRPLVKKAQVTPITPHKIRKSGGSYLRDKGINPGTLHLAMGHSDYRTTAKFYQGMTEEGRDAVADAFDTLLDGL